MNSLDSLPELALSDLNLVRFAGQTTVARGRDYFHQKRVQLDFFDEANVQATVRGTRSGGYRVHLELWDATISVHCTCPDHRDNERFCKHLVATALAWRAATPGRSAPARPAPTWQAVLPGWQLPAAPRPPAPFCLVFGLIEYSRETWELQLYTLPASALPSDLTGLDPREINHRLRATLPEWRAAARAASQPRLEHCLNLDPAGRTYFAQTLYARRALDYNFRRERERLLAHTLDGIALHQALLLRGSIHTPLAQPLSVQPTPGSCHYLITETEQGITLSRTYAIGGRVLPAETRLQFVVESEPPWILADNQLARLPLLQADRHHELQPVHTLDIPHAEIPEFVDQHLAQLADQGSLEGPEITWEDFHGEPEPRLYLAEVEDRLTVALRFGYGPHELPFDPQLPAHTLKRPGDRWTLVRVQRQSEREQACYRELGTAANGLKAGDRRLPPGTLVLRARTTPADFLYQHLPQLVAQGYTVFGEAQLTTARVNRHKPSLAYAVSSGVDWFDLQLAISFGPVTADFQDVRRALRKQQRFVKLADGSVGVLPEDWLTRYKHLLGLGEARADGIRLSKFHATLIDELLDEQAGDRRDPDFQARLAELRGFDGIQTQPLPASFQGQLLPYQQAGYDWLHFLDRYGLGGCLADDMGLGKTIQVLSFLLAGRERQPGRAPDLVVVPRSLLVNWQREAARFAPRLRVREHFGPGRAQDSTGWADADLIVTTYGIVRADIAWLREAAFHTVVLDEAQAIKNPTTQVAKAVRRLPAQRRLTVTGTPVENNTLELWSQFAFLNPGLLGSLEYFRREFALPAERGDEATRALLRKMIHPFLLRRTKQQVMPELPPKTEHILYTDMEPAQRAFYIKTRDYYRGLLLGAIETQGLAQTRLQVLEGLLRLRQICNHPGLVNPDFRGPSGKLELLLETLTTLQAEGHKALVFSQFVQMLRRVRTELERREIRYTYLDGRTRDRQALVDQFQADPELPLFLISLKAGGVGLNLTAADYVVHIDPWWNPAVELQATDRTHRIGQTRPIFVYKFITKDTVEEKVLQLQERKKDLVEQIIAGEASFFKTLGAEDIDTLFS